MVSRQMGAWYHNLRRLCDELTSSVFRPRNFFVDLVSSISISSATSRFELATNVVFLVRLTLAIGTMARHRDFREQGHGLKLIIVLPWEDAGFPSEGFVLSVCHWQRNWFGPTSWKYW
jgi:hypothetical protein